MGRRIPFHMVKKYADHMWANLGLEEISSNGQGMFIPKLKNEDDMIKVVKEGLWVMGGQPFFIKKWTKNSTMICTPFEIWNLKGLSYITSGIG